MAMTPLHFKVVVPSYNCMSWLPKCLNSIVKQEYDNYDVCVVDDASTDRRQRLFVETFCKEQDWVALLNEENVGCPRNLWHAINALNPSDEDVILIVDGDDWLPHEHVLTRLRWYYHTYDPLLTYGQFELWPTQPMDPGCVNYATPFQPWVIENRSFRQASLHFNHPLTFKYKLWRRLSPAEMQDDNGVWFRSAYDDIIMLPMLELCSPRFTFIGEILYVYNATNPLSETTVAPKRNREISQIVRHRPKRESGVWA